MNISQVEKFMEGRKPGAVGKRRDCAVLIPLVQRLKGMLCHVNLIPLNIVEESGFDTTAKKDAVNFQSMLEAKGIPATIRRELGDDIDGACGQLRLTNKRK